MPHKVFVHGVPDSPAIWQPLVAALGLADDDVTIPALPGFLEPAPPGFGGSKDDYAAWLIRVLEELHTEHGPLDIVGHDWGAILTHRIVMLRPELLRTWALSNAVIDPEYSGHIVARIWNTPLLGELLMAATRPSALARSLTAGGVPADIARAEAANMGKAHMKKAILGLYRSADGLRFARDWAGDLERVPTGGLLVWGENDPYISPQVARRSAARHGATLRLVGGAGHWAIAERPAEVAEYLQEFWSQAGRGQAD